MHEYLSTFFDEVQSFEEKNSNSPMYASLPDEMNVKLVELRKTVINRLRKDNYAIFRYIHAHMYSVNFINGTFSLTDNVQIPIKTIRKLFGNKDAGIELAKSIFYADKSYSNFTGCESTIKYSLNRKNYNLLIKQFAEIEGMTEQELVDSFTRKTVSILFEQYREELESGVFNYSRTDFRLYHPLQAVKRNVRDLIFKRAGYNFEIDIQSCAWNCIHQLAIRDGLAEQVPDFNHLTYFLQNRQEMYDVWCSEFSTVDFTMTKSVLKEILLASLHGARLRKTSNGGRTSAIFQAIDENDEVFELIRTSVSFNKVIKTVRDVIDLIREQKCDRESSRGKFTHLVYTEIEDLIVRQLWENYFDEHDVKRFIVHDGCYLSHEIDCNDLSDYVYEQIGIKVKIEIDSI